MIASSVAIVITSFPDSEVASEVVNTLVAENLAVCGTISGPSRSIYRWKGEVVQENEHTIILKTHQQCVTKLVNRLTTLHPYEVPEVLVFPAQSAAEGYESWVTSQCSRQFPTDPGSD